MVRKVVKLVKPTRALSGDVLTALSEIRKDVKSGKIVNIALCAGYTNGEAQFVSDFVSQYKTLGMLEVLKVKVYKDVYDD